MNKLSYILKAIGVNVEDHVKVYKTKDDSIRVWVLPTNGYNAIVYYKSGFPEYNYQNFNPPLKFIEDYVLSLQKVLGKLYEMHNLKDRYNPLEGWNQKKFKKKLKWRKSIDGYASNDCLIKINEKENECYFTIDRHGKDWKLRCNSNNRVNSLIAGIYYKKSDAIIDAEHMLIKGFKADLQGYCYCEFLSRSLDIESFDE